MLSSDALVSIFGLISVSAKILASIMAAESLLRRKDRSFLLLIVMIMGLIVIGFVIGSSLEP